MPAGGVLARRRLLRAVTRDLCQQPPDLVVANGTGRAGLTVLERLGGTGVRRAIHGVLSADGRPPARLRSADLVLLLHDAPEWAPPDGRAKVVGHPAAAESRAPDKEIRAFRSTFSLAQVPLLLVRPAPPGRLHELQRAAAESLARDLPGLRLVLADSTSEPRGTGPGWPGRPILLAPRTDPLALSLRRAALGAADLALLADGTESLWLAPHALPMVVAQDPGWLGALLSHRQGAAPLDLAAGTRVVPILRGRACSPARVAATLQAVLRTPEPQREAMRKALDRLGAGGEDPSFRAARALFDGLAQPA